MTIAAALILVMAAMYALAVLAAGPRSERLKWVRWVGVLIAIAAFGALRSPYGALGPQIRQFVNFASASLLFVLLVNAPALGRINGTVLADRLLRVMIAMAIIQIAIGLMVFAWPPSGALFRLFQLRTLGGLTTSGILAIRREPLTAEYIGELDAAVQDSCVQMREKGQADPDLTRLIAARQRQIIDLHAPV